MLPGFSLCKCLRSGTEWELNVSPQTRLVSQLWVVTVEEDTWARTWMTWFVPRPWDSISLRAWIWNLPYKHLALSAVVGSFGTCSPEVDDWGQGLEYQIRLLGEPGFSVSWRLLLLLEKWRLKLEGAELDAMPVPPQPTASSVTVSSKKSSLL